MIQKGIWLAGVFLVNFLDVANADLAYPDLDNFAYVNYAE